MTRAGVCIFCILTIGLAAPAAAQPTAVDPGTLKFPTATERRIADVVSTVEVGVALGLDAWSSCVQAADRKRGCTRLIARVSVVLVVTEAVKHLVARERPDRSDHKSFFSMHTALPASTIVFGDRAGGPRLVFTIPLAASTGYFRIAADKHFLTDTLAGAGVGVLASRFIR